MPRHAKFRPAKSPDGWRINIPAAYSLSGKRERYFYPTKEAALTEAAKLRERREEFGAKASAISPSLADQATAAAALLEPFGITLLEAAQRVAEVEAARAASAKVGAALDAFEAAKEGKSAKQRQSISQVAKKLRAAFSDRDLSTVTYQDISAHLDSWTTGAAAFNSKMRILTTFWRWAAKPPRSWCKADALIHIERRETVSGDIGVLTPSQARRLMETAEANFPETVPAFAIALFTGMRANELQRLASSDISAEGITVPAISAKTKRRRFVSMPPPLASWLHAYPVTSDVCPPNWARKERAVRRLAGWKAWSDLVDPHEPPPGLPDWPQNALRHTAATVAVALGKPIESLVFEHGHAGGLDLLRSHYVGRMTKNQALEIQSIGPHGQKLAATIAT